MNEFVVEEWRTADGERVRILQDTDSEHANPRDWDNLGTMVCWHGRYVLGDEQPTSSPDEYLGGLPENTVVLPLYLYDHSSLTMNTTGFSCPWDSGQVGFIFATPEDVALNGPHLPDGLCDEDARERVRGLLRGEVETYDLYLRGEVYGYDVETVTICSAGEEHTTHEDACWGFLGLDHVMEEATSQWPKAEATA